MCLMLVSLLTLSGCGSGERGKGPYPSPAATHRHDPSQAEISSIRKQLETIDGVQSIPEFDYQKGTFGTGPSTGATFTSTATAKPDLITILDTAYRLTWYRTDIAMGDLIYVVQNPATGTEVGAGDLGFDTVSIGPRQLLARYGPGPTTSAKPS
jgi:hypothetical protein